MSDAVAAAVMKGGGGGGGGRLDGQLPILPLSPLPLEPPPVLLPVPLPLMFPVVLLSRREIQCMPRSLLFLLFLLLLLVVAWSPVFVHH